MGGAVGGFHPSVLVVEEFGVRMPRSKKESDLEKAARNYKAKTGVGCDGFHPKVPLELEKETRGKVVDFLGKVEQCECGRWPQQACTTMII